jgi:hypothetical protein
MTSFDCRVRSEGCQLPSNKVAPISTSEMQCSLSSPASSVHHSPGNRLATWGHRKPSWAVYHPSSQVITVRACPGFIGVYSGEAEVTICKRYYGIA